MVRVRGDGTAGSAGCATQELWGTQALLIAQRRVWKVLPRWRSCSDRYPSKGSNMNAAGHPTRCSPKYREPADDCCLLGAGSLELATRTVGKSIAALGRTASGNTMRCVLLFSRPLIPVRKNYLTRRAGAWGLTSQRGRSRLVVQRIPGPRAGS